MFYTVQSIPIRQMCGMTVSGLMIVHWLVCLRTMHSTLIGAFSFDTSNDANRKTIGNGWQQRR